MLLSAPPIISLRRDLSSHDVLQQGGGIDSARAGHFESIFVDFETLDFRIERSCRQP
jgi:hypothetical protein